VATSNDTFDPNDLDSIDALLDEAELEATVDDSTEEVSESVSDDAAAVMDEVPLEADLDKTSLEDINIDDIELDGTDVDDTDGLQGALNDVDESIEAPVPPVAAKAASVAEPSSEKSKVDEAADNDDFLSKRAAAQTKQLPQMAAEDMDSIKKLIIIFSTTLIVLVLTGIGIGIWSALAASSAGVDDETITLIESLKVNSEQSVVSLSENTKSIELAEKKLDAINFQLEQLVTDLTSSTKVSAPKSEVLDPLGLGREGVIDKSLEAVTHSTAAVPAKADPAVLSKITSVNSKMIRAQRRIDEVNSRVKSIQKQYQVLLKSVKMVEKQIVMEQLAKAEKAEKEKAAKEANPYQYTAPDGMFYDQSVQDSYP
jgi:hypothetical protein